MTKILVIETDSPDRDLKQRSLKMNKLYKVRIVNRFTKEFIVDIAVTANSVVQAKYLGLKAHGYKPHLMAESATTNFKWLKVG